MKPVLACEREARFKSIHFKTTSQLLAPRFPRRFPRIPWDSNGIPQGFPGDSLQENLGIPWEFQRGPKGFPRRFIRDSLEIALEFPWDSLGDFLGIPQSLQEDSLKMSYGFLEDSLRHYLRDSSQGSLEDSIWIP